MNLFLYPKSLKQGDAVTLAPDQSKHLARVMRAKAGDRVGLINGNGERATAVIVSCTNRETVLQIDTVESRERTHFLTVAFAIPKNTALEFILKRCTELGVFAFQPIVSDHSRPVGSFREDRSLKLIEEVCKQCQEFYFPQIAKPVSLKDWLRKFESKIIVCDEAKRKSDVQVSPGESVAVLVGAEGGWSDSERELFESNDVSFLGLGDNRLRAETSVFTSAVILKQRMGEI